MKRTLSAILSGMLLLGASLDAHAFDPSSLLSGNGLSGIGDAITSMVANKNFELKDLVGEWSYSSPAVTFVSDNALQKVGGAAAATALEAKIKPYYEKFGFTGFTLSVAEDYSFTMKVRNIPLKGTIEKDETSGNLLFHFSAFKKMNLGTVAADASKSGSTLILTFDMTKLISIAEKVSSISGNSTAKALSGVLSSYDGLFAGFKLSRHGEAPSSSTETPATDAKGSEASKNMKSMLNSLGGLKK